MKTPLFLSFCTVALAACATLGPTPVATGVSPVPSGRPSAEVGLAMVPGYYLSQAVTEDQRGESIPALSGLFEIGELLGAPGVVVGGRAVGESGDTQLEPMLGYRASVGGDRRFSVAGVVHGTKGSASENHASYEVTRFGAELGGDVRLGPEHRWAEVHLFGSLSVTAIDATGSYCLDADGRYGVDCDDDDVLTDTAASGAFGAVSGGVAVDLLRHRAAVIHGARLSAQFAGGSMPRVVAAEQTGANAFFAIGLAVTVAFGVKPVGR